MKALIRLLTILIWAGCLLNLASCTPTEEEELIDEETRQDYSSQIVGHWVRSGSQEHWVFLSSGLGENWDESEDIHQGEDGSNQFRWYIESNGLMVLIKEGDDYIVPDPDAPYTIVTIDDKQLRWKTSTGESQTLNKQ